MSKVKASKEEVLLLKNQICFSMYSSMHRLMKLYRPLLADIGLTYPQYLVMLVMWEEKEITVTKLGDRLQLDSGTLTPLLKRLEKSGQIQRTRSVEDERVVVLTLTKNGKLLREKAKAIPDQIFCLSGIEESQAIQLKSILDEFGKDYR
ncbi:MarR family winged helix-turn-helix transcriptional regulator [Leptospira levettii]|uniref:MarR family winged helix-turn-helix transcriptional regulator n=1 Tax=Leptospira levettii TaxID=2023178 RepID=UPI001FAFDF2E|nr:MarR family transcriptional regulator [Leptospira levettii]MCW7473531.1 MarR family transcriptional regulator [Leptospira levettii]MCW7508079.1 MarR family transcriptional regulator [Leptospira levettii]MCW7519169.1 MarR family transcriptional regulator [Leptospira levettii]